MPQHEFVSYADVLALYCGRPKGYYDKMACNSEPGYGELKKAFPEVLKALEKTCPGCIEDNGLNKGKAYRYIGKSDQEKFSRKPCEKCLFANSCCLICKLRFFFISLQSRS